MAITLNPAVFLDVTVGVTLVGLAVTASLFGVSTSQAVWYYKHYPNDRRFLKTLVAVIWMLDALHLLLYGATMWAFLVRKQLEGLGPVILPWESSAQLLCNACAIVMIQSFYAHRIWTLSNSQGLATLLAMFICGDFALAITLFVRSIMTDDVEDFVELTSLDIALNATTATTDVLLSGTLVILLAMSRTTSIGVKRLINKLVLYTINTGLLTSICAILSVVAVILLPTAALYVMLYYIGTRLYSVSLLATLNARAGLRMQAERFGHVSLPRLSSLSRTSSKPPGWGVNGPTFQREVMVSIQQETGVAFEDDHGVKEEFRRRSGADVEVDESVSASSLRDSESAKMVSFPVLPKY
ncbi:hypothetical protein BD414DRAFT_532450 [Trametes punicea]|nr:hypothetical protein BD414DRAFT_532450 [Trametes punicea]